MGLRSSVSSSVNSAFKAAGDLAIEVTLVLKDTSDFNFNTGKTITTAPVSKIVLAILSRKSKEQASKDLNMTTSSYLLMKASDLPDPNQYDKAIIRGETWRFVTPVNNNGFIIKAKIVREAQ